VDYGRFDKQLLEAAVQGDTAAISTLITTFHPDLQRFARQVCATPEDVEDAVQETLWIISQKIGTLRQLSAFFAWAFRIVKHECLRLLKRSHQEDRLDPEHELICANPDWDSYAVRHDIITAIQELKPKYREVLILRDVAEMTAPEVADLLGISVSAVKSCLHRARSSLRTQLEQWSSRQPLEIG
jgi:RNA polymerase sigma factor (sigma-70 family)